MFSLRLDYDFLYPKTTNVLQQCVSSHIAVDDGGSVTLGTADGKSEPQC